MLKCFPTGNTEPIIHSQGNACRLILFLLPPPSFPVFRQSTVSHVTDLGDPLCPEEGQREPRVCLCYNVTDDVSICILWLELQCTLTIQTSLPFPLSFSPPPFFLLPFLNGWGFSWIGTDYKGPKRLYQSCSKFLPQHSRVCLSWSVNLQHCNRRRTDCWTPGWLEEILQDPSLSLNL